MKKIEQYRYDVYAIVLGLPERFTNKDVVAEVGWPMADESKTCQVRQIINEMVLLRMLVPVESKNKLVTMQKTPALGSPYLPNPFCNKEI